eukprot:6195059-Pleurochrysis_carterae.AAC.1
MAAYEPNYFSHGPSLACNQSNLVLRTKLRIREFQRRSMGKFDWLHLHGASRSRMSDKLRTLTNRLARVSVLTVKCCQWHLGASESIQIDFNGHTKVTFFAAAAGYANQLFSSCTVHTTWQLSSSTSIHLVVDCPIATLVPSSSNHGPRANTRQSS